MRLPARKLLTTLALAHGTLALDATAAHAFSDTAMFNEAPGVGGGGGRYFTGSGADGFTCAVCHQGGPEPELFVRGLPLSGYVPRTAYEIVVDWPDGLAHISLALEITDDSGIAAGALHTPAEAELQAPELCTGTTVGAAQVARLTTNRNVITMPDCGAQRVRFLWTAPDTDRGPVHLAGAVVQSNGSATADGDGVTELARTIGSPSSKGAPATQIGGCSAASGRSPEASAWWASAFLLAAAAFGRRKRR